MERVGTLINKLQEQYNQQAGANKLLLTAQMLLAELQQKNTTGSNGKISVTMPSIMAAQVQENIPEPEAFIPPQVEEAPIEIIPTQVEKEEPLALPIENEKKEEPVVEVANTSWLFDHVATVPTLAHQNAKEVFELNATMVAHQEVESHNDKLKEQRIEVAAVLQGSPIKDLKKAIGINDRYVFINELFRGDENMYERSIKTINAFSIYPEAEYWIQREMKTKLGWTEDTEAVRLFDQLVKRRFS